MSKDTSSEQCQPELLSRRRIPKVLKLRILQVFQVTPSLGRRFPVAQGKGLEDVGIVVMMRLLRVLITRTARTYYKSFGRHPSNITPPHPPTDMGFHATISTAGTTSQNIVVLTWYCINYKLLNPEPQHTVSLVEHDISLPTLLTCY